MTDSRRPVRPSNPRGQPLSPGRNDRAGGASLPVRAERYLVAALSHMDAGRLINEFEQDPQVRVVRTIQPAQRLGAWDFPPVAVVETTADHAASLAAQGNVHVEVDHALGYGQTWLPGTDPGVTPLTEPVAVTFAVTDTDARALPGAMV